MAVKNMTFRGACLWYVQWPFKVTHNSVSAAKTLPSCDQPNFLLQAQGRRSTGQRLQCFCWKLRYAVGISCRTPCKTQACSRNINSAACLTPQTRWVMPTWLRLTGFRTLDGSTTTAAARQRDNNFDRPPKPQNLLELNIRVSTRMTTFTSMQPKTCSRLGQLAGSSLRQPQRLCCSASRRSLAVRASGDGSRVDRYDKHSIIVSPSILSADFAKLGEQVLRAETAQQLHSTQQSFSSHAACCALIASYLCIRSVSVCQPHTM